jgi:hypothetical protein
MRRTPGLSAVVLLVVLLLFQSLAPDLQAQTAPPPPPPTPQELDQLLAPIALYPDSLLAQITTASTNPQEILDVDNWLAQNPNLSGTALTNAAEQKGFDPAFIALVTFPQVLQMMADNIDDYAAIGEAVSTNQAEVSASIQRLRAQAYTAGSLRSSSQQQVEVQQNGGQPVYAIQPANPQVVYVPQYDPTVVYAGPSTGAVVAASLITFGVGIGIGALLVGNRPWGWGGWGWNWGARSVYYNHAAWGGWRGGYRAPQPWYRPRPVVYRNRPGFGGNWRYRPTNYRRPVPNRRPVYTRPGTRPGQPANRPPNRPVTRPTQPGNRPGYNRPVTRPTNRPANPPANRPGHTRPTNGNRPAVQPARPTTRPSQPQQRPGGNQQQNRPAAQHRPAAQNRPAGSPQNRPQNQQKPSDNKQQRQGNNNRPQNQNSR